MAALWKVRGSPQSVSHILLKTQSHDNPCNATQSMSYKKKKAHKTNMDTTKRSMITITILTITGWMRNVSVTLTLLVCQVKYSSTHTAETNTVLAHGLAVVTAVRGCFTALYLKCHSLKELPRPTGKERSANLNDSCNKLKWDSLPPLKGSPFITPK